MSRMMVSLATLAAVCFTLSSAQAQSHVGASDVHGSPSPLINATTPVPSASSVRPERSLSHWISGTDPDCCGPVGNHNPMQTELFVLSGLSIPVGTGVLQDSLKTGWAVEAGGRALFFNDTGNLAWTLSTSLLNIHNLGVNNPQPVLLRDVRVTISQNRIVFPESTVTVNSLNRTYVNLGTGFEYYLMGAANGTRNGGGNTLRVGFDGGGRWGTAKAEFHQLRHFTDTIGGIFAAIHSDYEIPCGCCTYFAGLRAEWDYTWSDILQIQNKSDVQSINLGLSFGVHY